MVHAMTSASSVYTAKQCSALTNLWMECRPSSRTYKTVFKAVRPSVAMF